MVPKKVPPEHCHFQKAAPPQLVHMSQHCCSILCFFLIGFDYIDLFIIGIYFIEYFTIIGAYSEI